MGDGTGADVVHVVVATALIPEPVVERLRGVVRDGVTVSYAAVPWSDTFAPSAIAAEWVEPLARAHVLVGFPQQISGLVEAAPALRWVQYYGAGYEGAPLEELRAARIGLVSAAGAGADGVAEFAAPAVGAFSEQRTVGTPHHRHRCRGDRHPSLPDGSGPGAPCDLRASATRDGLPTRRRQSSGRAGHSECVRSHRRPHARSRVDRRHGALGREGIRCAQAGCTPGQRRARWSRRSRRPSRRSCIWRARRGLVGCAARGAASRIPSAVACAAYGHLLARCHGNGQLSVECGQNDGTPHRTMARRWVSGPHRAPSRSSPRCGWSRLVSDARDR
jgi:hypothetical protein